MLPLTDPGLAATLGPVERLALAYAPKVARPAWLALLALDARLAGVVAAAREPILAQLKLAWWRDRLSEDAAAWPLGEPLLAALRAWRGAHGPLVALVDGWEALLGESEGVWPASASDDFAQGRAAACVTLAHLLGEADKGVADAARDWAWGDLPKITLYPHPLASTGPRLSRAMRPLVILRGMASRAQDRPSLTTLLTAMRLGILGR